MQGHAIKQKYSLYSFLVTHPDYACLLEFVYKISPLHVKSKDTGNLQGKNKSRFQINVLKATLLTGSMGQSTQHTNPDKLSLILVMIEKRNNCQNCFNTVPTTILSCTSAFTHIIFVLSHSINTSHQSCTPLTYTQCEQAPALTHILHLHSQCEHVPAFTPFTPTQCECVHTCTSFTFTQCEYAQTHTHSYTCKV